MKFWQVISWCETEHIIDVARHAESLGFEGIILAEHIYYPASTRSHYFYSSDGSSIQNAEMNFPDPLITFAAIASVTQKLRMMTGIYVLPLRHPIDAAKNMATLARLSNNRFQLGIGAGWLREEFDQFNVSFDSRGQRMDEMIEVMGKLWTGNPVTHHGHHFNLEDVQIRPYPSEPIRIIAGGHSRAALARSTQRCNGWYGPGNSLDELKTLIPELIDARKASQNSNEEFEIIAPLSTPLSTDACIQLEELGVTGTVSYPFLFGIGPNSSLDDKKAYMENFAKQFITG